MSQLQHHYMAKHRHGKGEIKEHKKTSPIGQSFKHALARARSQKRAELLRAVDLHLKSSAIHGKIAEKLNKTKFEMESHRKNIEKKAKPSHPAHHRLLRVRK